MDALQSMGFCTRTPVPHSVQFTNMTTQRLLPLLAFFALSSALHPASGAAADPDDRAVPYYTGTVYPTPQQALYRDEFLPLTSVGLVLGV